MLTNIAQSKRILKGLLGRNVYINNISLSFNVDLLASVHNLIKDLITYINFLDEWYERAAKDISSNEGIKDEDFDKANEFENSINLSAVEVIEEATKIKTRDIGKKEKNMSKESEATVSKEPTLKDIEEHLVRIEGHVKQSKKKAKAQAAGSFGFTGMAAGMALVATGVQTTGGLALFIAGLILTLYSFYYEKRT